ncbi:MAG TPA: hypothetical protein DCS83_02715 [Prevotella sp.]|nr:DUF1848 domain-containing protein [uncultured Prevotella sp.]HAT61451.1 hypothetical protein [Prevotella sp.]
MSTWKKEMLPRENGEMVSMQTPVIISASRSTDIPAFYADWFFHRLKAGYSAWINPFNGQRLYVSYRDTRFIVFWSKNPLPLLSHLDELKEMEIGCYIQYSLNDYEKEKLERNVRPLQERIDTFKRLVDRLGYGHVVWRFDPLILTDNINIELLLKKIRHIGRELKGYTEKLIFSYADILAYRKVKANLEKENIAYREWTEGEMLTFARQLSQLNESEGWKFNLATCSEKVDLSQYGIAHNRCIDDELMIRLAYHDTRLMDFLKVKFKPVPQSDIFGNTESLPKNAILLPNGTYATHGNNKDAGQRQFCGCIVSKDIGQYNTCIHMCEYCYANTSKATAVRNYKSHGQNPYSETII